MKNGFVVRLLTAVILLGLFLGTIPVSAANAEIFQEIENEVIDVTETDEAEHMDAVDSSDDETVNEETQADMQSDYEGQEEVVDAGEVILYTQEEMEQILPMAGVATYSVSDAVTLATALSDPAAEIYIDIKSNITYSSTIQIRGRKLIYIFLNGHTVTHNVTGSWWFPGIRLYDGAAMTIYGHGVFNITSPWDAITAGGSGSSFRTAFNATVNATATGSAYGVYAHNGGYINITGNATVNGTNGIAAYASFGSTLIIGGDVSAPGSLSDGVYAGERSRVYITGNIKGGWRDIGIGTGASTNYFSASSPTRRNVQLPDQFSGYDWDEFTDRTSYVYKRHGSVAPPDIALITAFVIRLYDTIHERSPGSSEVDYFVNLLASREITGAETAYAFFFSPEMINRNLPANEYVNRLYYALHGRTAGSSEIDYWLERLEIGYFREDLLYGFVMSNEFEMRCNAAGINRGSYTPPPIGAIRAFVIRLYKECHNRTYPSEVGESEVNFYVNNLLQGRTTGTEVAHGFFFSPEFLRNNPDNETYINILYRAMLDRPGEPEGITFYLNNMSNHGVTRTEVFFGFADSDEFAGICARYGIRK